MLRLVMLEIYEFKENLRKLGRTLENLGKLKKSKTNGCTQFLV